MIYCDGGGCYKWSVYDGIFYEVWYYFRDIKKVVVMC